MLLIGDLRLFGTSQAHIRGTITIDLVALHKVRPYSGSA